jgi:hypothetical protein
MANLIWDGKKKNGYLEKNEVGTTPLQILDLYPSKKITSIPSENWQNLLIRGENGDILDRLIDDFENKITLVGNLISRHILV